MMWAIEVYLFMIVFVLLITNVVIRLIGYLNTLTRRRRVSYVPKANIVLATTSRRDIGDNKINEFVRLCLLEPVSHCISLITVKGHCEDIRLNEPGDGVDVDVIGNGRICLFWNLNDVRTIMTRDNWGRLGIRPFTTRATIEFARTGEDFVRSVVAVIISEDETVMEITRKIFNSTAAVQTQYIIEDLPTADSASVVNVQDIFTGMGQEECMVCYERRCNTIIVPCRHCSVCTTCMRQLREPRCVVCRHNYHTFLFLPTGSV